MSLYWAPLRQDLVAPVSTKADGVVWLIVMGIRAPLTPLSLMLLIFISFLGDTSRRALAASGCHCSSS